jgi:hypothetical protein
MRSLLTQAIQQATAFGISKQIQSLAHTLS